MGNWGIITPLNGVLLLPTSRSPPCRKYVGHLLMLKVSPTLYQSSSFFLPQPEAPETQCYYIITVIENFMETQDMRIFHPCLVFFERDQPWQA